MNRRKISHKIDIVSFFTGTDLFFPYKLFYHEKYENIHKNSLKIPYNQINFNSFYLKSSQKTC